MASCLGHYFGGRGIGLITETIHVPLISESRVTIITAKVATSSERFVLSIWGQCEVQVCAAGEGHV